MKKILLLLFLMPGIFHANEYYLVKIKTKDYLHRTKLHQIIHFDSIDGNLVYSIVNEKELGLLKGEKNLEAKKIESSLNKANKKEFNFPQGFEGYHTVSELTLKLKKWEQDYPGIFELSVMGKTFEGRDIYMARLSSKKSTAKLPASLFIGSHHAREHLSTEVPLGIMEHLLKNYRKDLRVTELLNTTEAYFIPLLNPDGAHYDLLNGKFQRWRKNRSDRGKFIGTDLNRNYPAFWGSHKGSSRREGADTFGGETPFSEEETKAIKNLIEKKQNIRTLISYHTFGELILYPWGGKKGKAEGEDKKVFDLMAKKMATWTGYEPKPANQMYLAAGEFCDWAYGVHQVFCFTFELSPKGVNSDNFYPKPEIFEKTIKENLEPALYMMEMAKNPYSLLN